MSECSHWCHSGVFGILYLLTHEHNATAARRMRFFIDTATVINAIAILFFYVATVSRRQLVGSSAESMLLRVVNSQWPIAVVDLWDMRPAVGKRTVTNQYIGGHIVMDISMCMYVYVCICAEVYLRIFFNYPAGLVNSPPETLLVLLLSYPTTKSDTALQVSSSQFIRHSTSMTNFNRITPTTRTAKHDIHFIQSYASHP